MQQHRSRKHHVPPSSVDHAESSSSSIVNIAQNNFVSKTSGGEEVQKVLDIILNAKNLIVICGMIKFIF